MYQKQVINRFGSLFMAIISLIFMAFLLGWVLSLMMLYLKRGHMWRVLLLLLMILTGCSGGAVVFAPTPLPADAVPIRYQHPSGAFTILLPRTWSVFEQALDALATASFSPPDETSPLLQIAVVNLGREIAVTEMGELMLQYQTEVRPDLGRYTEQTRQAMGDGSWRITGLRITRTNATQQINTFIQSSGSLLAVIEVVMPPDAVRRSQLQTIINTFSVSEDVELPVAALSALSGVASSQLAIVNLHTWTTAEGVFFVTGEVVNHSTAVLSNVPIRATLLSEEGLAVADAADVVMGYGIAPGEFAPFSLRFGQGQPTNATRYRLTLGSEDWEPAAEMDLLGADSLIWEDATQYTPDGDLFITGTVTNASAQDVRNLRAIATVFDERGRVVAASFADVEEPVLAPDEAVDFTILISDLGAAAGQYVVNVQALPCDGRC